MIVNFAIMIICGIFQTVEFYVISVLVAATVLSILGRGGHSGPVRQVLLGGVISLEDDLSGAGSGTPSVEFICGDDGNVILRRRGLRGLDASGAVSLAIDIKGFDVFIRERVTPGRDAAAGEVDTASFILDFMGPEHYFISYTSDLTETDSGHFISLTLHNRAGNHVRKNLI